MNANLSKSDATIYDDLDFNGEAVRDEPPLPVEIRDFPVRFSLLQMLIAMTVVALFSTVVYWLGFRRTLVLSVLFMLIGLQFYFPIAEYRNNRQ